MGVEEVIFCISADGFADQIDAAEVDRCAFALLFRHHVAAVQQEVGLYCACCLAGTDSLRVVGILSYRDAVGDGACLLVEAVVGICPGDRFCISVGRDADRQDVAVGIVSIGGGDGFVRAGLGFRQQMIAEKVVCCVGRLPQRVVLCVVLRNTEPSA